MINFNHTESRTASALGIPPERQKEMNEIWQQMSEFVISNGNKASAVLEWIYNSDLTDAEKIMAYFHFGEHRYDLGAIICKQ